MSEDLSTRLEVLDVDECLELLSRHTVGRAAFADEGGAVHVIPVNYLLHAGTVVFRTTYGRLLDALHRASASFQIDEVDEERRTGWSVLVQGTAEEVSHPDELGAFRDLPLRPWAPGERHHFVQILPRAITGRRITASVEDAPVLWLG